MPGARRMRLSALILVLFVLVLLYITTAKRSTYSSPFYTRTVEAISERKDAAARADVVAKEKVRQDRITRLQDEHDIAMSRADADKVKTADMGKETQVAAGIESPEEGQKPVAGRKLMKDGRVVVDETGKEPDGVAKVGNVQAKAPAEGVEKTTDDERKAEAEINAILKKGPIIIFSKSYCPYSKKAKHILQDAYSIVPPPFVVELDTHPIGALLQASLKKTTGRGTVPNILVNGKSIGGGDDIQQMHDDGKLIDTLKNLGGKRVMDVKLAAPESKPDIKKPVRLRV